MAKKNPFEYNDAKPPLQAAEGPDPFAVLKLASSEPVRMTPAKEITQALTPDQEEAPPEEFVGPVQPEAKVDKGKPGTVFSRTFNGAFKKGPLKGMDKSIFFSMLADTMVALGRPDGKGPKFTRMALERKQRQDELKRRAEEIEDERAWRAGQAELDRQARAEATDAQLKDSELGRAHQTRLKLLDIDARDQAAIRRHELEAELLELQKQGKVTVQAVNDTFDGISQLEGLRLPPHINPEAALQDPNVLEEARRRIAPFKRRAMLERIKAQRGDKVAKDYEEALARVRHRRNLWSSGVREVDPQEMQLTGDFTPFQPVTDAEGRPVGSVRDQVAAEIASVDRADLLRPEVREQLLESMTRAVVSDYSNMVIGSEVLDGEMLQDELADLEVSARAMIHNAIRDRLMYFSQQDQAARDQQDKEEAAKANRPVTRDVMTFKF